MNRPTIESMTEPLVGPAPWVAHVCVASGLAHLDRPFDYLVPEDLVGSVAVGVRVKVKLAGRACDGIVVGLDHDHEPGVRLAPLTSLVSPQVVTSEEQLDLARAVADHYAGTLEEVLRWAVPPRHRATEVAAVHPWPDPQTPALAGALAEIPVGRVFLARVGEGEHPRAHWRVAPVAGPADDRRLGDWRRGLAQAVVAALVSGRSAVCVLPTVAAVEALVQVLDDHLGAGTVAQLHSDQPAASRWRNYLAVVRGQARVVVGTRSAVMAPVADLGLVAVWDEGNDLHSDPRAPYPHARDVAALRAQRCGAALLLAGPSCSTRAAAWLDSGWMVPVAAPREELRSLCAPVRAPGDSDLALARDPLAATVRLPDLALRALREGLLQGPVLVSVPRVGQLLRPRCATCREPIVCPRCSGPVSARREAEQVNVTCTVCGASTTSWACPHCGSTTVRSGIVGSAATSAQLGKSFPHVPVIDSSGDHVHDTIGEEPVLVVATPGAEPHTTSGFGAVVILDATTWLSRPGLDAVEETLLRWFHLLSLARGARDGGRVVVVGPPGDRAVQALIRNDPTGWALSELAERREAGFPPAVAAASVEAATDVLTAALRRLDDAVGPDGRDPLPGLQVLGPVPLGAGPGAGGAGGHRERAVVRAPLAQGARLSRALAELRAAHTLHRESGPLRVQVDKVTE